MSKRLQWLKQQGEQLEWDWGKLKAQEEFLTCTNTFSMYSGGFGTGKTSVLCAKVIACLIMIPNNLGYLGRLDGKSLKQSTMIVLEEMLDSEFVKSNNKQEGVLQLKPEYGGSRLLYGDFKDMNDLKNLPLGFFALDQAEEVIEDVWLFLSGRLRRKCPVLDPTTRALQFLVKGDHDCLKTGDRHYALGKDATKCELCNATLPTFNQRMVKGHVVWDIIIYPRYGFGVCNPENPEHWIYQSFPNLPGYQGQLSQGKPDYAGFSATTYEALEAGFVDQLYVKNMENTFRHVNLMVQRYLYGRWVLAEGLVYPSFNRTTHVYNYHAVKYTGEPLFKDEYPLFEYIDHGSTAVTAVGWVYVEPCDCGCGKHNYYLHREHYVGEKGVEYHSRCMKQIRSEEGKMIQSTQLDAQCFSKTFSQKNTANEEELSSIAELYLDNDIFVTKNQKDWDSGWNMLTEILAIDENHVHPITGEQGAPHLLLSSMCPHAISEFGTYKWKKVKPGQPIKDEPQDGNDHHMDGLNGWISGRHEVMIQPLDAPDTRSDFRKALDLEEEELFGFQSQDVFNTPAYSHMSL